MIEFIPFEWIAFYDCLRIKHYALFLKQVQVGEVMPFIEEILNNISTIICDLQPQQVRLVNALFPGDIGPLSTTHVSCYVNQIANSSFRCFLLDTSSLANR